MSRYSFHLNLGLIWGHLSPAISKTCSKQTGEMWGAFLLWLQIRSLQTHSATADLDLGSHGAGTTSLEHLCQCLGGLHGWQCEGGDWGNSGSLSVSCGAPARYFPKSTSTSLPRFLMFFSHPKPERPDGIRVVKILKRRSRMPARPWSMSVTWPGPTLRPSLVTWEVSASCWLEGLPTSRTEVGRWREVWDAKEK